MTIMFLVVPLKIGVINNVFVYLYYTNDINIFEVKAYAPNFKYVFHLSK